MTIDAKETETYYDWLRQFINKYDKGGIPPHLSQAMKPLPIRRGQPIAADDLVNNLNQLGFDLLEPGDELMIGGGIATFRREVKGGEEYCVLAYADGNVPDDSGEDKIDAYFLTDVRAGDGQLLEMLQIAASY